MAKLVALFLTLLLAVPGISFAGTEEQADPQKPRAMFSSKTVWAFIGAGALLTASLIEDSNRQKAQDLSNDQDAQAKTFDRLAATSASAGDSTAAGSYRDLADHSRSESSRNDAVARYYTIACLFSIVGSGLLCYLGVESYKTESLAFSYDPVLSQVIICKRF
jgi:hypothetical protein